MARAGAPAGAVWARKGRGSWAWRAQAGAGAGRTNVTHLLLGEVPAGEEHPPQPPLPHRREKVRLIPLPVKPPEQLHRALPKALPADGGPHRAADAGKVPCCERVRAQPPEHVLDEGVEFDVPVAGEVGAWGEALLALGHKVLKDMGPVLPDKVDLVQGDAQVAADRARVGEVVPRGAPPAPLVDVVPVAHEHALHPVPCPLEEQGRNG